MAYGDKGGTSHGFPAIPGNQLSSGGFASFKKPKRQKAIASPNKSAAFRATPKSQNSKAPAPVRAHTNPPSRYHAPANPSGGPKTPTKPRAVQQGITRTAATQSRDTSQTVNTNPYGSSTGLQNVPTSDLMTLLQQQARVENDAQAQAEAADRARIMDFNQRMMGYLSGLPGQVGADYDKAIAQSAALGNASAQLLGAANPNASIQADLAAIGAPSAQQQQVTNTLQNAFQGAGAVLFQQGSVLPGQALESEKASQQAYYRGMGGVAQQKTQDLLGQLASQSEQQRAGLKSKQIDRLIAAQQYETERQDKQAAAESAAASDERDYRLKLASLKQNEAVIRSQIGDRAFNQQVKAANVGLAKARVQMQGQSLAMRQLQNNRQWKAELARLGIADKGLQLRAAQLEINARKKKSGGKQPSATDLQEAADLAYYGQAPKTDSQGNQTGGVKAVSYQTALFALMNQGVPLAVAQRYLNEYYAPGERGRPKQSFQQRQAKRKKR